MVLNLILNYDSYTSNLMLKTWNFDSVAQGLDPCKIGIFMLLNQNFKLNKCNLMFNLNNLVLN